MYKPGGTHIFLDVWVDEMPRMYIMKSWLTEACNIAGSTILGENWHKFEEEESPFSYTGIILLSESHASIHTWPEHKFLSIDFFFCGNANWEKAVEFLQQKLNYNAIKIQKHNRGESNES